MVADEAEAPMGVDRISISVDTSIVATVLDLGMVRAGQAVDGGVDRRLATSGCGGTWLVSDRVIIRAGFELFSFAAPRYRPQLLPRYTVRPVG